MVKQIPLQNNMFALVDDDDYERVNQFIWSMKIQDEINVQVYRKKGRKHESLSHFILNKKLNDDEVVSFTNKNNFDFRKDNLKVITKKMNTHKSAAQRNTTSQYKGVSWNKKLNKWRATIRVSGKLIHLGYFFKEEEAAIIYNNAAYKHFGEHSYQNIIGEVNFREEKTAEKTKQRRRNKKQSYYHGVTKFRDKWRADITGNYIGLFISELEAAKAYDVKAKELFGDKAILNFPNNIDEKSSAI